MTRPREQETDRGVSQEARRIGNVNLLPFLRRQIEKCQALSSGRLESRTFDRAVLDIKGSELGEGPEQRLEKVPSTVGLVDQSKVEDGDGGHHELQGKRGEREGQGHAESSEGEFTGTRDWRGQETAVSYRGLMHSTNVKQVDDSHQGIPFLVKNPLSRLPRSTTCLGHVRIHQKNIRV